MKHFNDWVEGDEVIKNKVFLGGTSTGWDWRKLLIKDLKDIKLDFFNPIVEDWTEEDQKNEIIEREEKCNIHLYCITSDMVGVYSIAEIMDSVLFFNNEVVKTLAVIFEDDFDERQLKSFKALRDLIILRGGNCEVIQKKDIWKVKEFIQDLL